MKSVICLFAVAACAIAADPPKSWIDPETGHRVLRLTDEPGSASLYFNQNGYTADGKKMVYTTPQGISVLDLKTMAAKAVVTGRVRVIVTGRKSQNVYYTKDGAVWATDVDTLASREIAKLPARGSVSTVNADETLVAGTYTEVEPTPRQAYNPNAPAQPQGLEQPANKGQMMEQRLAARIPMALFLIDTKTGRTRVLHRATDWLNHLEFSPTDPTLLMFCHEGPWHKVDRIWTIRTDGSSLTKVHTRTMEMEIFGHEFWSQDGQTIWYDLQTPRGEDFWLAGYNVANGERRQYHLQRDEWSIHFNVTKDARLFCGDGGDPGQVAKAKDGQWIYLFRAEDRQNQGVQDKSLVKSGVFRAERLVNMAKHNYRLEPNVSFSPDEKWVIFRSNMFGETYTFAVEVDRAGSPPARAQVFSNKVPGEGNYRVTVTLGSPTAEAVTTVKAELRRLMIENVRTAAGKYEQRSFLVNVRRPQIAGGGEVRLKPRERESEAAAWDDRLTLSIFGAVAGVDVEKADDVPTLYIAGDSTSTDQPVEPFNSWGQMLTRFLKPEIAVANHGESGESLKSFIGEGRLAKVMSVIRPGDYLFIQMGHNDQKERGEGIGAFTSYQSDLERFVADARQKGATPVLVTSMHRMTFDADGRITNSLGDYPEAVRRVARDKNVPLIDLNAMSKTLYEAIGPAHARRLFAGSDTTHHSDYGSYELAKCVVEGIRASGLPLAKMLADTPPFDPAHPDPYENFNVPAEPLGAVVRPYGQ